MIQNFIMFSVISIHKQLILPRYCFVANNPWENAYLSRLLISYILISLSKSNIHDIYSLTSVRQYCWACLSPWLFYPCLPSTINHHLYSWMPHHAPPSDESSHTHNAWSPESSPNFWHQNDISRSNNQININISPPCQWEVLVFLQKISPI